MNDGERLNKFLSACGVCSRREADRLIEAGRVYVNGNPAPMGTRVFEFDQIELDGRPIKNKDEKVVYAFYKPIGVTCTEKDKYADVKITDIFKAPVRVTYAGRLDKDSEGLILMTNDGNLINKLMKAANYHEKEYKVRVNREISEDFLNNMRKGVFLKELDITTRPCIVEKTGKCTFSIILTQGVNRQIRRMCKALNYHVLGLKRVRIANIQLANLKPGEFRKIEGIELQELLKNINKNCE